MPAKLWDGYRNHSIELIDVIQLDSDRWECRYHRSGQHGASEVTRIQQMFTPSALLEIDDGTVIPVLPIGSWRAGIRFEGGNDYSVRVMRMTLRGGAGRSAPHS